MKRSGEKARMEKARTITEEATVKQE